ncbi:MAG: DUF721 domain-containing protein [Hyphomicrobium sp.]
MLTRKDGDPPPPAAPARDARQPAPSPATPTAATRLPPDQRKRPLPYLKSAGSFVPKLTSKAFERFGFHSAEIMTSWREIVGADLAGFTRPERLKWPRHTDAAQAGDPDAAAQTGNRSGATLILRVDPARALDVEYRAHEIADRINRYFGYRAVATIKIFQGPIERPDKSLRGSAAATPMLSPSATGALAAPPAAPPPDSLDAIADEGLKAALQRLWASIHRARPPGG